MSTHILPLYFLKFTLQSDAAFGRGDGIAGWIDSEVQHDEYGCPYLGGRTLRGVLVEECANILFSLGQFSSQEAHEKWQQAAQRLFGNPGSQASDPSILHVGNARLPHGLRQAIQSGVSQKMTRQDVLESLTTLRRQTAMDIETGAPQERSLRTVRLVLRQTPFIAELRFMQPPGELDLALLAACIKAWRRAGTGRNRGRGELRAQLLDHASQDITQQEFDLFRSQVEACR